MAKASQSLKPVGLPLLPLCWPCSWYLVKPPSYRKLRTDFVLTDITVLYKLHGHSEHSLCHSHTGWRESSKLMWGGEEWPPVRTPLLLSLPHKLCQDPCFFGKVYEVVTRKKIQWTFSSCFERKWCWGEGRGEGHCCAGWNHHYYQR